MKKELKELKQFSLENKDSCIIYLQKIISTAELNIIKLKKYIQNEKKILDEYNGKDTIPYDIYSEEIDKIGNVTSSLLNIIGDSQNSSISYFKYRNLIEKLVKRNVDGIDFVIIPKDIQDLLMEFNKMRNWMNHIPESLITSEIIQIQKGKYLNHSVNPIEIYLYYEVQYDYFKDFLESNNEFYKLTRKIIQICKKDYSILIGESVQIKKTYMEEPIRKDILAVSELSAEIQGLHG